MRAGRVGQRGGQRLGLFAGETGAGPRQQRLLAALGRGIGPCDQLCEIGLSGVGRLARPFIRVWQQLPAQLRAACRNLGKTFPITRERIAQFDKLVLSPR